LQDKRQEIMSQEAAYGKTEQWRPIENVNVFDFLK